MAAVGLAGFPDGASSRLPAEQHLVPGVQDHDAVCGGGVDQAAGENFQLLVGMPLGLQGEERSINPSMSTTILTSLSTYMSKTSSMTTSKLKFVILKRLNK